MAWSEGIGLYWHGTGEYSNYYIRIDLDESNTATIDLGRKGFHDTHYAEVKRIWNNASIAARDKIALAICGNVGIVPGSMDQDPAAAPYFPFNIAPGSALAKMTKLIPENLTQAEELERIFNKG